MSKTRQSTDADVLVRFWSLNHHRPEPVLWPTSPWDKLVYAESGTLHVETDNRLYLLPPNRALWVPAGTRHPSRTLGRAQVRTLYFSPQMGLVSNQHVIDVRPLFRELIKEACRVGPLLGTDPTSSNIASLLQVEILAAPHLTTSIPMPQTEWLKDWADEYLSDPSTPPTAGFSRRTLERHMLAETQLTLGQWCQQARALSGLRALSQGSTVLEATIEAGYRTTSGFIQAFRKQFGITPGRILHSSDEFEKASLRSHNFS